MSISKNASRKRIHRRIRKKVSGTSNKPRVAVYRSNKAIYAQAIDDLTGTTLAAASSTAKDIAGKGNKIEQSKAVGMALANMMKSANIEHAKFDRGGYLYHGRIKALAEGLREGGLHI